jgi:hypothetical protein
MYPLKLHGSKNPLAGAIGLMLPHSISPHNLFVSLKNQINTPILTSVVQSRMAGWMIIGAAGLQAGLVGLGLPGWQCPFLHATGLPCPGCGLSRAIVMLLQGDWRTSLELHAFAPFFVLALLLITWITLLPQQQRPWVMDRLEMVERRTGITAILLVGLMLYWLVRLLVFPGAFINFIKG